MAKRIKIDRSRPNILITGTPGNGKSRLAKEVAAKSNFRWIDVSAEAELRNCCPEVDELRQCKIIDEDLLVTALEPDMAPGGVILDYHACDFFPERWINGVFVLRTDNTILYDRLTERGYEATKVQENVSAEIFQTILEEAQDSYNKNLIFELRSDNETDFAENVEKVVTWIKKWEKKPVAIQCKSLSTSSSSSSD